MTNQATETTHETQQMNNILSGAFDCLQNAMNAGIKFQQDAVKMMTDTAISGKGLTEITRRTEAVAGEAIATIRKNAETAQKLFDETSKTGLDVLRRCHEATSADEECSDRTATVQDLWKATFDAMQANTQAMTKANVNVVESLSEFTGNVGRATGPARDWNN